MSSVGEFKEELRSYLDEIPTAQYLALKDMGPEFFEKVFALADGAESLNFELGGLKEGIHRLDEELDKLAAALNWAMHQINQI